jgi:hypothetical protein
MRALLPILFLAAATPAGAQGQPGVPSPEVARAQGEAARGAQPTAADVADVRVNQLVIFEGDTCPQSGDPNEVTICVTAPASQRYRIPENLRSDPNAPENQAWTNTAIALSYAGAAGIGSCSPTGPGGFTGCQQQLINQAVAERRGRPDVNWARLIEEARQQRLGGINRAAAEAEAEAGGNRRVQQLQIQPGQLCPPSTEAVILSCTYPDGSIAPTQPAGEPQLPVAGGRDTARPPVPAPSRPQQ